MTNLFGENWRKVAGKHRRDLCTSFGKFSVRRSGKRPCVIAKFFTIERHLELLTKARRIFDQSGLRIVSKGGDGTIGWTEFAPYDGIIVTAGAPDVPEALKKQLAEGGRIVIPVGEKTTQRLVIVQKNGAKFSTREVDGFKFVPLVGKHGWN